MTLVKNGFQVGKTTHAHPHPADTFRRGDGGKRPIVVTYVVVEFTQRQEKSQAKVGLEVGYIQLPPTSHYPLQYIHQ